MYLSMATADDVQALSVLAVQTFVDNFGHLYEPLYLAKHLQHSCSADYFAARLEAGDHIVLARTDAGLAGYAKYGAVGLPVAHDASDSELHRLYVHALFQSSGVGKQLMQHAIAAMQQDGAKTMWVGVWERNARAQHFYMQHGFAKVGDYLYRVGPHADREWIMKRG